MKNEKYNSRILKAVHETAQDMHKLGFIDKRKMREYDFCVSNPWFLIPRSRFVLYANVIVLARPLWRRFSTPVFLLFKSGKSEINILPDLLSNC